MHVAWQSRPLISEDQSFLWDMCYIALWDAPDEPRRPRTVLDDPRIRRLVESWGRDADVGIVAIDPISGNNVGAVWARLDGYDGVPDFGCDYPFVGIAIEDAHQGNGAGTYLLSEFIELLRPRTRGLRLGVNPKNARAMRLYEKFGFRQYALGTGDYPQMKLGF